MDKDELIRGIVKGLEWEADARFPFSSFAGRHDITYEISDQGKEGWMVCFPGGTFGHYPSLAAAQAVAEADYRARIAAALDLDKIVALVEAAHGLSFGEDWNNGTHAKIHRPKLLAALAAVYLAGGMDWKKRAEKAEAALADATTVQAAAKVLLDVARNAQGKTFGGLSSEERLINIVCSSAGHELLALTQEPRP